MKTFKSVTCKAGRRKARRKPLRVARQPTAHGLDVSAAHGLDVSAAHGLDVSAATETDLPSPSRSHESIDWDNLQARKPVKVYLQDGVPSAAAIGPAVRHCLLSIVEEIVAGYDARTHTRLVVAGAREGERRKKNRRKMIHFDPNKCFENLHMYFDEANNLLYPCCVLGCGPSSSLACPTLVVELLGFGMAFEIYRKSSLQGIPKGVLTPLLPLILATYHRVANNELCKPTFTDVDISKYWDQRYRLFSRFDRGVLLDKEAWFSVTPEAVAIHIARVCLRAARKNDTTLRTVVDLFCGNGGNTIPLTRIAKQVVSVDFRQEALDALMHNAAIYECPDNILPIRGDVNMMLNSPNLTLSSSVDLILMSPPWGGTNYSHCRYNLRTMIASGDGVELLVSASKVCSNIVYVLPRNVALKQVLEIARIAHLDYRIEFVHLHKKHKMTVVYFGPLFCS